MGQFYVAVYTGGCCWQSSTVAAAVRLGRVRVCPERGGSQGSTQFHT